MLTDCVAVSQVISFIFELRQLHICQYNATPTTPTTAKPTRAQLARATAANILTADFIRHVMIVYAGVADNQQMRLVSTRIQHTNGTARWC